MSRLKICLAISLFLLLLNACAATLPTDFERPQSYALPNTQDTTLGQRFSDEKSANSEDSGFYILGNGRDAFVARAVLAHLAERSIDVQYYLFHDDLVGRLFTDQLVKAADRGVRVRVLVDDMDMEGRDFSLSVWDSHPNIEIRLFNPFSRDVGRTSQYVTRLGSVTRRMHNKSFTVDNQVTILGGRNIGNEYFEADPDLDFSDLDVMGIGPVAREVSVSFDQYWNNDLAYPVAAIIEKTPTPEEILQKRHQLEAFVSQQADSEYLEALKNSSLAEKTRNDDVSFYWGKAEVVFDQPEKLQHDFDQTQYHLSPQLTPYFKSVEKELIIFSPYFVPGKAGTALLTQLAQRGVRVRILTNSLASNDVSIVHAGYAKYRMDLLRGGVELYEMNKELSREQRKQLKGPGGSSKASLHAKSFVFDRQQIFIGSLNLDPRAVLHNTEIGVIIFQPDIANGMGEWFDHNIDELAFRVELVKKDDGTETILWHGLVNGEQKTFRREPYVGFWRGFGIDFLSILPIDSQL